MASAPREVTTEFVSVVTFLDRSDAHDLNWTRAAEAAELAGKQLVGSYRRRTPTSVDMSTAGQTVTIDRDDLVVYDVDVR